MDTHETKYLLTTKITKDTKVSEILFFNFVLFVSFVVKSFSPSLLAASPRPGFADEK